jgi:small subunit ribosomal protein S2
MRKQPDAVFIVDLRKEQLAVREARRLGLPIVALVDTNCDPDDADFVIPGNDDAIRSCSLIVRVIADAIAAGASKVTVEELAANGRPEEAEAAPGQEAEPEAAGETAEAEAASETPEPEPEPETAEAPAAEKQPQDETVRSE